MAFEVQADDLGEGAFVSVTVEADGEQVEQLAEAFAVAQPVGALADELLRELEAKAAAMSARHPLNVVLAERASRMLRQRPAVGRASTWQRRRLLSTGRRRRPSR